MRKMMVKRKNVQYKRPDVAGLYYYENMTYYHNLNSPAGKVILMYLPADHSGQGGAAAAGERAVGKE